MNKIQQIIQDLELDLLEFVESDTTKRKKLLPLTDPKDIKALIWNLLNQEKYKKQISYKDYSSMLDVLFDRLKV